MVKKWYNKLFLNDIRKVVEKYTLIENGDNLLIGLSGGKDSIFLIYALKLLRENSYLNFNMMGIHMDIGINMDMSNVENYLNSIDIPYLYKNIDIKDKIFNNKKSPCYICAKMKRGAIARISKEIGANKIVYGHHMTDVVNTFLLNMIYTGQFHTFKPNSYNKEHDLHLIRPLIYVKEDIIKKVVADEKLPLGIGLCTQDNENKRKEIGILIDEIKEKYPDFEEKAMNAIMTQWNKYTL